MRGDVTTTTSLQQQQLAARTNVALVKQRFSFPHVHKPAHFVQAKALRPR